MTKIPMFKNLIIENSLKIGNCKLKIIGLLAVLVFIGSILAQSTSALTMSSSNYIIQMGNLNMAAGRPTDASYKLGLTVGQTAPGLYTDTNYKVKAGFWYLTHVIPFAFSISHLTIDFGALSPTEPVTRTSDLIVSLGSASGYSVTASENHQLLVSASGAMIPDTTCDNGICTQTTSASWTSTLTYGFGYRCDHVLGTDCASGFADATYHKQFANTSIPEDPVAVMKGANAIRNKRVTITYKVNVSSTQAAGSYTNLITYIATPTF